MPTSDVDRGPPAQRTSRVVHPDLGDRDAAHQVEVDEPAQQDQLRDGVADEEPHRELAGRPVLLPLVRASEHREADVLAVTPREQDPPGLLVAQLLRRLVADPLVVGDVADHGAEAGEADVRLTHTGRDVRVGDGRELGGDVGGRGVEARRRQRRPAAELDLQLQGGQPVAVAAVDDRLAGVQGRDMRSGLLVDLLEVVPHHRREHAAAPVVRVNAHPAEPGARHLVRPASGPGTARVIGNTP